MVSCWTERKWRSQSRRLGSDVGAGLTEAIVSTAITAVGVLSVAVLFIYGTRLTTVARDSSNSMSLATQQLELLHMLPVTDPTRQNGGSLTTDLTNYSRTQGNYRVRWTVAAGPATTTTVTVLVTPIQGLARPAQLNGLLWR